MEAVYNNVKGGVMTKISPHSEFHIHGRVLHIGDAHELKMKGS